MKNHRTKHTLPPPWRSLALHLLLLSITNILATQNMMESSSTTILSSVLQESPDSNTLLRGRSIEEEEATQLKFIRQKLRALTYPDNNHHPVQMIQPSSLRQVMEGELPPAWKPTWHSLSDDEMAVLSRDSSFLHRDQHRSIHAAYVSRRTTNMNVPKDSTYYRTGSLVLLRGSGRVGGRDLQWMTHGQDSVVPGAIVDGEVVHYRPHETESVQMENTEFMLMGYDIDNEEDETYTDEKENLQKAAEEEEEEYTQDLYKRLREAMETTQRLERQYAQPDIEPKYTYNNTGSSSFSSEEDEMVQKSAPDSNRQRLLTGSYAVWQWYDRNNLASPGNIDFDKLSRVNYAFFQTDGDGYLFGTDSWADPNVLYGPYEFAVNSEKIPPECKGGRGRDNGKPMNATTDEFAIYDAESVYGASGKGNVAPNTVDDEEEAEVEEVEQEGEGAENEEEIEFIPEGEGVVSGNNTEPGNIKRRRTQNFQYPDYTNDPPCKYFEQCHRNFPNSKTCNIHKYKEGLIYIAHTHGTQVYPSIGGWTLSNSFPAVAADPQKRLRFARECVGIIADYGFDGIDIDWEYPGYEPHGGSAADRRNFNELLLAVRVALNEYQEQTGDAPVGGGAFGLTAALPCGPANINFLDVNFLSQVLNGMNLMTFDFHNEQEPLTGVASPLYDQSWGEKGLSVDGCVKNYYKAGAGNAASKISIGVPFYGKTYSYATELNGPHSNTNGLFGGDVDQANWPQDLGTPVFYNMLDTMNKGVMMCKRHEPTQSAYAYFKDGSGLVTYDDPQAACNKVEYVINNLLGGLFIWELSGDMLDTLSTPILDAINRKLDEINFDCSRLMMEEDCSRVELPPPSPKGPDQVVADDVTNMTESILVHLQKAEAGELLNAGKGYGAFTRTVFMMRAHDGSLFPSYTYRFEHFVDSLAAMAVTGVNGERFYLGGVDNVTFRKLQADNSTEGDISSEDGIQQDSTEEAPNKSNSLVFGIVNIAAFLAQAMTESIIHDACDEFNVEPLPNSIDDGIGLDDGRDHLRFPMSNACGQNGRSYQDEQCKLPEDSIYDCANQLNREEFASMELTAYTRSRWPGSPGPFYCGPNSEGTGFWDTAIGSENRTISLANAKGRTDVEGCCFWGRGCLLSVKGTCLLGKLNYHLGANKAQRDGKQQAMFPDVDFCLDPNQICAGLHSTKLRWIIGLYHWIENVQSYNADGYNYLEQLDKYVGDNLEDNSFILKTTRIHLFGCHLDSCGGEIPDIDARVRNFEKVLLALNLQFTSYAKAEPLFELFPGQIAQTRPPVAAGATKSPTGAPVTTIEKVETQVLMFLTGVPPEINMTNSELKVFDTLMLELLVPRLQTADVDVVKVKTVSQKPNSDFIVDSNFNAQAEGNDESVLELVLNVSLSFYPPEPDGWRDWSIYLKSWIESFGNTMVDIFTSPKNPQHPETNSKFWDDLTDISSKNVPPGGLVPKEVPTPPPTYIVFPEPSATNKLIMGMGIGVGVLAFIMIVLFGCYIYRKSKQNKRRVRKKLEQIEMYDRKYDGGSFDLSTKGSSFNGQSRSPKYTPNSRVNGDEYNQHVFNSLLDGIDEESENESSSDSSSSDSSSDSSEESNSSSSDSSNSSGSSSEGSAKDRKSALKIAYERPLSTGTRSNSSMSGASENFFPTDSSSNASESFASQNRSAEMRSYASENPDNMSRSQATESANPSSVVTDDESNLDLIVDRILDNDPSLQKLDLSEKNIGIHSDNLFDALASNSHVKIVDLSSNVIDDDCASSLSVALMENSSIVHINLSNNFLTSAGAEYLIGLLDTNATIQSIDLGGNDIDDVLLKHINDTLKKRKASSASLASQATEGPLEGLVDTLNSNDSRFTVLCLDDVDLTHCQETEAVIDALAINNTVQKLSLINTAFDDTFAASLSLSLVENKTIRHILLSDNLITNEGCDYLIGTLDSNHTIVHLDLSGNYIDDTLLNEIDAILSERSVQSSHQRSAATNSFRRSSRAGSGSYTRSVATNSYQSRGNDYSTTGPGSYTRSSAATNSYQSRGNDYSTAGSGSYTRSSAATNSYQSRGNDYSTAGSGSYTRSVATNSYQSRTSNNDYSTAGSVSSSSVSSRVSSVASSLVGRSNPKRRDDKASAKIAGKDFV